MVEESRRWRLESYRQLLERKKELRLARIRVRESFSRRPVRTVPRDPEEAAVLIKLTVLRWQRWLEEGKIERLGPRRYRLKVSAISRAGE